MSRCQRRLKQRHGLQLGPDFLRSIPIYNEESRSYSVIVVYNCLFVVEVYSRFANDLGMLTLKPDNIRVNMDKPTE